MANGMTLLPVHFTDAEDGKSLGWYAMPVVPAVDDGVQLPGMLNARVTSRRWEHMEVADTASMRDAGLYQRGFPRWVAIVSLGDWEAE